MGHMAAFADLYLAAYETQPLLLFLHVGADSNFFVHARLRWFAVIRWFQVAVVLFKIHSPAVPVWTSFHILCHDQEAVLSGFVFGAALPFSREAFRNFQYMALYAPCSVGCTVG